MPRRTYNPRAGRFRQLAKRDWTWLLEELQRRYSRNPNPQISGDQRRTNQENR